ncbi:MAG: hypothetical protein HPY80_00225 [Bacteroidales bacterium]|nr:hypothetical protein [Bacteroidales bacterium]
MTLQEAIRILSQNDKSTIQVAKVVKVTGNICTVDFEDGRPLLDQVRLKAVIDDDENAFLIIPKEGSYVLINPLAGNNANQIISAYSVVERLELKIETTLFKIDKEGFLLSRQNDSLQNVLSDLIDAINSITVPTGTGPSGTPINSPSFNNIKLRLQKILKNA